MAYGAEGSSNCTPWDYEGEICMVDECCWYTSWAYEFGLTPVYIMEKPYTFITSMFLHMGFQHFIWNMFALLIAGAYLERLIKAKYVIAAYFIGGFGANAGYVITAPLLGWTGYSTVGASGAICVLCGLLIIIEPTAKSFYEFFTKAWVVIFIMLFTAGGVGLAVGSCTGAADNVHVMGIIIGAAFGYFLKRKHGHWIG